MPTFNQPMYEIHFCFISVLHAHNFCGNLIRISLGRCVFALFAAGARMCCANLIAEQSRKIDKTKVAARTTSAAGRDGSIENNSEGVVEEPEDKTRILPKNRAHQDTRARRGIHSLRRQFQLLPVCT